MIRRPPRAKRTDTLFPYPTLFRSRAHRLLDSLMKGKGASFARAKLLAYIHENAPTRSADIVAAFKIAPRTATMALDAIEREGRSEEHTSELQSLMRISYAVFCLKTNKYARNNRCTKS